MKAWRLSRGGGYIVDASGATVSAPRILDATRDAWKTVSAKEKEIVAISKRCAKLARTLDAESDRADTAEQEACFERHDVPCLDDECRERRYRITEREKVRSSCEESNTP